jgi:glycosyltransferase involved in cell wall biosynthesis
MSLRVPYVASDVGGVREMTPPEAHSFIVSFGDVPHFAQAVDRLIADPSLRSHIGDTLRQWVARYDKKVILEQFSSLFRGIS